MRIGIVNNSLGNVGSVRSALEFYRYDVRLVAEPEELEACDLAVLAGVGTYRAGMGILREKGFAERLDRWVRVERRPLLGICLGMQLFADRGLEEGEREGFGWIPGRVVRIDIPGARVPHIGWSPVEPSEAESGRPDSIFSGIRYGHFYFMHGYHFLPDDPSATIALTPLGEGRLVSALRRDNLVGVQFHPEKSQGDGLRVLRNIVEGFRR